MKLTTYTLIFSLLSIAQLVTAAVNGSCNPGGAQGIGIGKKYGVCVSKAKCNNAGGSYTKGDCPNDPEDIRCCYEPYCAGAGSNSLCMWASDCTASGGRTIKDKCAGPDNFKCCIWARSKRRRGLSISSEDDDTEVEKENDAKNGGGAVKALSNDWGKK